MRRLLAVLLVLAGCATTQPIEKKSEREQRLETLEAAKDDYERNWRAAQLCSELADEDQEHLSKSRREEFAKRGLAFAEKAIKQLPEAVEGHFYKLICLGRYLELSTPAPVLVADLRDEGERTARIDERFECSGAHRFLAIFYSQAPESGPYGYGSADKAEEHFQKALQIAGDCPENHLAYAEFQLEKMSNKDGARDEAKKALELIEKHPGLSPEQRVSLKKKAAELAN